MKVADFENLEEFLLGGNGEKFSLRRYKSLYHFLVLSVFLPYGSYTCFNYPEEFLLGGDDEKFSLRRYKSLYHF